VLSCAANPDRFHGISKRRVRQSSKRNWCLRRSPRSRSLDKSADLLQTLLP
jgi:hypothetical protein